MTSETLTIPHEDLHFTVDVAGPKDGAPVLLLHGFPETRHMWRHQRDALGAVGFRAVVPDQRGYSRGARPGEESAYATDRLVGDALAIMDALGHAKFHLVGHDWGGQLSWLIAAAHPGRLHSLSILSRPHPAAFARAMKEDAAQSTRSGHHRAFREADAVARMRAAKLKPLREALINQGVPPGDADIYVTQLLEDGAIEGAMNWYRASGIGAAETPKIATPTLYVWGTNDATVGRRAAELTAEYVTGPYRFVEIEGAGHFVVDQEPERVTGLLLEHIRR
ncbi:MAG TPA: alpha/beta hydrolase [Rhizomicrobium sp.]|jgi:pimeloyl-ACP methyl ester carboxylesterase